MKYVYIKTPTPVMSAHKLLDNQPTTSLALFKIHEIIEPMIPGRAAPAFAANFPSRELSAFNLFFIHSLAPPFLSLHKNAKEVAQAFQWIYENTPLNYPKTLIVDDGKEFYSEVTKLMEKHDVIIQRGDPSQHQSQGIVERFNRTLADRLFTYQYHKEFEDPSKSNREWVSRLQNVVSALNNEKTRLIGMKPIDAIKQTLVEQGFSQPAKEYEEKLVDIGTKVRYLYEPGELEGQIYRGERRKRSTDPIWSVDVYKIKDRYVQKHQPTLYYLDGGPKRSFVSEELQPIQDL